MLVDTPHDAIHETPAWERRAMAERWLGALQALGGQRGFAVLPLIGFPATGAHNADLPEEGVQAGRPVRLDVLAEQATLILAMTQFSASAPLIGWTQRFPHLTRRLDAHDCPRDGGHRARRRLPSGGALLRTAARPAGRRRLRAHWLLERRHTRCSFTLPCGACGRWAVMAQQSAAAPGQPAGAGRVLTRRSMKANAWVCRARPTACCRPNGAVISSGCRSSSIVWWMSLGRGEAADDLRDFLTLDAARRNVAELGLGCNPTARVWGNVLEDEKAGPHIALGRSEHLGGATGPDAFSDPRHVWHQDLCMPTPARSTSPS